MTNCWSVLQHEITCCSCCADKPPTVGCLSGYQSAIKWAHSRVGESVEYIISAVTVKWSTQALGDGPWWDVDIKIDVVPTVLQAVYVTEDLVSWWHLNLQNTKNTFHFFVVVHVSTCRSWVLTPFILPSFNNTTRILPLASCLIYARAFTEYVCRCVLFQDVTVREIRGR